MKRKAVKICAGSVLFILVTYSSFKLSFTPKNSMRKTFIASKPQPIDEVSATRSLINAQRAYDFELKNDTFPMSYPQEKVNNNHPPKQPQVNKPESFIPKANSLESKSREIFEPKQDIKLNAGSIKENIVVTPTQKALEAKQESTIKHSTTKSIIITPKKNESKKESNKVDSVAATNGSNSVTSKRPIVVTLKLKSGNKKDEFLLPDMIPCNLTQAKEFHAKYGYINSGKANMFRSDAQTVLRKATLALNSLNIPFFLDGGTLLGWFRQCDVIPQTNDMDVGVMVDYYNEDIITTMENHGFTHKLTVGLKNDSYEISFRYKILKLDVFFFYEDTTTKTYWKGSTLVTSKTKYRYVYPQFKLCWTKLLDVDVRIPCPPGVFIRAIYGDKWMEPVSNWKYYKDPKNIVHHGHWNKEQIIIVK